LKQLKKEEQFEEFMKEASLLVLLTHKNVLQFYGIYTSKNFKYIVTEYLDKGSLRDLLIKEGKKLSSQDLLSM
jgi:serine/threonine protein kinase